MKRSRLLFALSALCLILLSRAALAEICDCDSDIRDQIPDFDSAVYLSVDERYKSFGT